MLVAAGGIVGVGYGIFNGCPSLIGQVDGKLFVMIMLCTDTLKLNAINEHVSPGPTV